MNYEIVANHSECHSLKKNSHRFGHSTTLLMETLLTLRTWLPRLLVDSSVLYRVASFYGVHHLASHLFTTTLEQPPNWPEPRFVYKISNYIFEYCLQCSPTMLKKIPKCLLFAIAVCCFKCLSCPESPERKEQVSGECVHTVVVWRHKRPKKQVHPFSSRVYKSHRCVAEQVAREFD